MSRFLRFFRVFVFAIVCMFGAFSANAANTSSITVCDDSSDAGNACVRFDSANAGAPTSFTTPLSSNSHLTAFPYKPGYGYAGHYTGRECGGTQILDHTGAWTGNSVASGNIYACWVPLVYVMSNGQPSPYYKLFVLDGNGGSTGNMWPSRTPIVFFTNDGNYGGNGRPIRFENRGDWVYLYCMTISNSGICSSGALWEVPIDASGYVYGSATSLFNRVSGVKDLPTRQGYSFGGVYSTSSTGGTQYCNASGDTINMAFHSSNFGSLSAFDTIHARWNAMTVNLSGNYATPNPVYFNGTSWYSDINATSPISGVTVSSNGNLTFNGYYTGENGGGVKVIDENGHFVTPASSYVDLIHDGSTLYPYWTGAPTWATLTINNQNGGAVQHLYYPLSGCSSVYYRATPYCDSSQVTAITPPVKYGWVYGGHWTNTDGTGTQYINSNGTIAAYITGNVEVYANWTFGVSLPSGQTTGPSAGCPSGTYCCVYGTTCNAPSPTASAPSGQVFAGWACSLVGTTGDCALSTYSEGQSLLGATNDVLGATGITLTATWEPQPTTYYTISLNNNNGTFGRPQAIYEAQNVGFFTCSSSTCSDARQIVGSIFTAGTGIDYPTKTVNGIAQIFDGYWTAATGDTLAVDSDGFIQVGPTFSGDTTLWAQWLSPQTVTLSVGDHGDWGTCGVQSIQVVPGHAPLEPQLGCGPTPADGWEFMGYYDGNGTQYYDSNLYAQYPGGEWPENNGPSTLTAHWTQTICTLNYYCNLWDTDPVYTDQRPCGGIYVWNGSLCNSSATQLQAGAKVDYWHVANGSGAFVPGQIVANGGSGTLNWYAHKADIFYVTLDHCGSSDCITYPLSNNPEPDVAYYSNCYGCGDKWYSDAAASTPLTAMYPEPTKMGFDLQGYYPGQDGTGGLVIGGDGGFTNISWGPATNDSTIYAQWSVHVYTVKLNAEGGSLSGTPRIYYRADAGWVPSDNTTSTIDQISVPTPPQSDYVFDGWYTDQNGAGTRVTDSNGIILPEYRVTANATPLVVGLPEPKTLYAKWSEFQIPTDPNEYFAITTTNLTAGTTFGFSLGQPTDLYVQWDVNDPSTVEHIVRVSPCDGGVSGDGITNFDHTYTTGGVKTIKFWGAYENGRAVSLYCPWESYNSAYGAGDAVVTPIEFDDHDSNKLIAGVSGSLGKLFPTIDGGGTGKDPGFYGIFRGGQNLTSVPSNLFSGVTNAVSAMFMDAFSSSGLTSIPGNLFSGISGAAEGMFSGTFSHTPIETIPSNLFSGVTGAAPNMFNSTFYDCTNLTAIPSGLFGNVSGGADGLFADTFESCTSLETIPANLFSGVTSAAQGMFVYTFHDCTSLETIPEGLFNSVPGPAPVMFNGTFLGCTSLTQLPNVLFAGISNSNNGGPVSLDDNNAALMFGVMFGNDSALSGYIPKTLFANMVDNTASYPVMGPSVYYSGANYIFDGTNLATSCDPYNLTQYTTGFESYWNGKVSCAPAAVFSCENTTLGGGTGTPNPNVIWADQITGSTTLPAATNCTAPTHYTKPSTAYWACTGNSNCTGNHWAAGGTKPSWLTSSLTQSVNFYMEYTPAEYSVTLDANGGTAGNVTTLYETYNTKWATTSGGTAITSLGATQLPTRANWNFLGYWDTNASTGGNLMIAPPEPGQTVGQIVASTTTLTANGSTWHARWSQSNGPFTATYLCGDHGTWADAQTSNEQTVNYGQTVSPAVFASSVCTAATGYTFDKWKIDVNGVLVDAGATNYTWPLHSGSDIVAQWSPVQTTITLNKQGGTGGPTELYTRYGNSADAGVYLDSGRTLQMKTGENPIDKPAKVVTVTLDFGDSAATMLVDGQTYTGSVPLPISLAFNGYFDNNTAGTKVINNAATDPNYPNKRYITPAGMTAGAGYVGNQTWYAQWEPFTAAASGISEKPKRVGYVFAGWWTTIDNSGTQITDANGQYIDNVPTISADVTWYAHWDECSHSLASNSHATATAMVATDDGMCQYHITCDVPINGYSQGGGTPSTPGYNVGNFNIAVSLNNTDPLQGCLPRVYNIHYDNVVEHGGTMPANAEYTYTYGVGLEISYVPTSQSEVFEDWCWDAAGTDHCGTTQTISNTAYGDKIYYAKWSGCRQGYRTYNYDVSVTADYDNRSYSYPAGACAPGNYVITCDNNCPQGETCFACLEDINICGSHLGQRYGVYSQTTYNGDVVKGALGILYGGSGGTGTGGVPFGGNVYGQSGDTSINIRSMYASSGCNLPAENIWQQDDYVAYMTKLGQLNSRTFGRAHYTFNGLWTHQTSEENQYRYLPTVNGTTPWSQRNADGKALSEFFTSDATVYAHWIPDIYSVKLIKNTTSSDTTQVGTLYEEYGNGWANAQNSQSFVLNYELPSNLVPSRTGHTFAGYWTDRNGGTQVVEKVGGVWKVTANAKTLTDSNASWYAHWDSVQTTITLDNASATVNGTASLTAVYGEGAYLDVNGTLTLMTTSGPAINLPQHKYTISFDMNYSGALTGPDAQTPGWPFKGYFNSASGSRKFIGSDGKITSTGAGAQYGASGYTTNQTWYAQWTAQSATMTLPNVYDPRSGHAFGRPGYVFTGWWTTANDTGTNLGGTNQYVGGTDTYSVTDAVVDSNYAKTLYAHWEQCTYTGATNATNVAITNADTNACVYTITCPANYACGGNSGCEIEGQPNSYAPVALPECVGADFTITYYDNPAYETVSGQHIQLREPQGYSYNPSGTVTLWTPDGDILAAHHASSVTWCRNTDGTNCINGTTVPADSGNVTLYAVWTCAMGYTTYGYTTQAIQYDNLQGESTFPAGTCAPVRYRVECDKNCPEGGETCNACLEDFRLFANDDKVYSFGNVYNTISFNYDEFNAGLLPVPVYPTNQSLVWPQFFTLNQSPNPNYAVACSWWPAAAIGSCIEDSLVSAFMIANYVDFMTELGSKDYNSDRAFGATHYDFGGLWTDQTLENDGYKYIGADGLSPTGGDAFGTQEMMNFFTSDTTVYAHWTPKKYRVILNKNSNDAVAGTVGELWEKWNAGWALTENGEYTATRTLAGAQLPNLTGYTFAGYWDTSASTGGNAMGSVSNGAWTTPAANATDANPATWYARWTPNAYTVTYDCGLGGGNGLTDNAPRYGAQYTPKTLAAAGCDTALVGHYFNGWNVTPGHSNSDIKYAGNAFNWDYTENQTFTARWVAKTYHITFAKNGGNGGTDEIWEHYGNFWHDASQNHVTTISLPTKDGYTFMGYALSGTTYISSATLPEPNLTFGDTSDSSPVDVTLTAQWSNAAYNIQYNLGGGTVTLPVGYVPVEYITFDGNQVIDTGLTVKKGYEIQTKFRPTATGKYVYGALSSGNSKTVSGYISTSGGNWRWGNKTTVKALSSNNTYIVVQNASALTVNGVPVAYETQNNFETDVTLSIGKAHNASGGTNYDASGFKGRMYWFTIRDDNGNVVYHGVPVKNTANNQYGLCNIIDGTCLTVTGITGAATTLPTSYSYGTATTVSGTPSRANSVFQSWCRASLTNCATPHEITATDSGNITLYAKWNCDAGYSSSSNNSCVANHIILNWDENNGDYPEIPNGECTYNGNLNLPGTPTNDTISWVFNGWKLADNITYKGANSTVNGGCVQTYTGVTSGTSTAIQAKWCNVCDPVHATCTLDASTPGTCSYTTQCESGFYHYVSGENTYNPVCAPYTITYQSQDSNGVSHGDGAVQEILSDPFTTNGATDSSQFNWANHIVTAWTSVSGGNFPNVGGSYTYDVQSDTVLKANWGECQCTPGTGATSCDTTSNNNECEVIDIVCDTGFTGSLWSCEGVNCTATCNNDNRHTITLNKNDGTGGTDTLYTISGTGADAGVYIDSVRTSQYLMTPNPDGTNPVVMPTLTYTVSYVVNTTGAHIVTPTSINTTATAVFKGYYNSKTGADQYIENTRYITSLGSSKGKEYTTDKIWYAQWTYGTVTLPYAYRPGYRLTGWWTTPDGNETGNNRGNAGDTYTPPTNEELYAHWQLCVAGSYCPGMEVVNNETLYNVVHSCSGDTGGKYENSQPGSTMISDCYLVLIPGKYVSTAGNGMVNCSKNYYCDDNETKVYYSNPGDSRRTTGIRKSCATNAGSFGLTIGTGADEINDCYKNVTLNKRGGTSGSTALGGQTGYTNGSTKCYYDTNCTLPNANILTLPGYTFYAGWTDQADTDCNDNTIPFVVSPHVPDDVGTYYACRTTNGYTVALKDGLNTSVTFESITPSYNQPMPTPLSVTPTHTGGNAAYGFTGYYDAQTWISNQTQYYNANLASVHDWQTAGNGTLYAQWEITCNPGYYLKANETVCSLCPAGKYCDGTQSFVYVPWNADQGITGNIAAGYYSTGGASTATPTAHVTSGNGCYGQVNNVDTACGLVAGGYYSTGGGTSATPTATRDGCLSGFLCGVLPRNYFSTGGGTVSQPTAAGCVSGQFCGICPATYRASDATGNDSITDCVAACAAGTQVATAENPTVNNTSAVGCTTPSGNLWWSNAHEVAYGSASPIVSDPNATGRHSCLSRYNTPTTTNATDHDNRSDCTRTVPLYKNGGTTVDGAVWPNNVTDNGGTAIASATCAEGETCDFGNPANLLEQTGYTFQANWGNNSSCGSTFGTSVTTPQLSRYYACKVQNNYTLTYACGTGATGDAPNQQTNIHYGDTVSVSGVGNCAKTGHSFAGWVDSSNAAVQPDNSGNITWEYTSNQTFTAQWTANTYNISYVWNGGTPASLLPDGYTLLKYIESDGSQVIDTGVMGINKRVVLDAKYTGTNVSSYKIPVSYGSDYGGTYAAVYANKWGVNSGQLITGAAINNRKTVEVVFDLNSASSNKNRATMTINGTTKSYTRTGAARPDGTLKLFAARLSVGSDAFIGQIYSAKIYDKDTDELLFNGIPARNSNGDLGLYDTVSGEFFINQGSGTAFTAGDPVDTTEPYPNQYTYGVGATVTGGAARANSVFDAWCRTASLTNCAAPHEITTTDMGDITLYAKWGCLAGYHLNNTTGACDANEFILVYNKNGHGTEATPENQTCTYGGDRILAGALSEAGWVFRGWSIAGETYGGGETIFCNEQYLGVTGGATATTVNVTADWVGRCNKITLNKNNASAAAGSPQYLFARTREANDPNDSVLYVRNTCTMPYTQTMYEYMKPRRPDWTYRGFYATVANAADINATQATGTGATQYFDQRGALTAAGQTFVNGLTGDVEVYAGWAQNCVTTVPNGSCSLVAAQDTHYDTTCETGYHYGTAPDGVTYNPATSDNTSESTYYPVCVEDAVIITLNKNTGTGTCGGVGGTANGTMTCYYGETCSSPIWNSLTCNINNGSKIFTGWNTESDGTGTPYGDAQIAEGIDTTDATILANGLTLYAQWADVTCNVEHGTAVAVATTTNTPTCAVNSCDTGYGLTAQPPYYGEQHATTVNTGQCNAATYDINYELYGGNRVEPNGYTLLEYVTADGNQYFDTGIAIKKSYEIRSKFEPTTGSRFIYGVRSATSNDTASVTGYMSGNWRFGSKAISKTLSLNTVHTIIQNVSGLTIDGTTTSYAAQSADFTTPNTLLFGTARNYDGISTSRFIGDIYEFRILDGNRNDLMNLVPARRDNDGAVGFYDTVSGEFFTSIGSGDFAPGPAISEEYTLLDFIQSSGTQYIKTNFIPTTDFKHTIVFEGLNSSSTSTYIAGTAYTDGRAGNARITSGKIDRVFGNNPSNSNSSSNYLNLINTNNISVVNTKSILVMDLHNNAANTITLNGTDITSSNTGTITSTSALSLFAYGAGSSKSTIKLYRSTIEQGGVVVHDYVPARRNRDGELGVYDMITGEFLTNLGTGTFVASDKVLVSAQATYPDEYMYGIGANVYGVPVRANSVFEGWCRNAALTDGCTMVPHAITATETGVKVLHAKWSCVNGYHLGTDGHSCVGNSITIDYQNGGHGGTPNPATATCTYGSTLTLAGAMGEVGYTFTGWGIIDGTGTLMVHNEQAEIPCNFDTLGAYSGSVNATAQWDTELYMVTYACNTNWTPNTPPASQTVRTNGTLVVKQNTCINPGYRFVKWLVSNTTPQEYWDEGDEITSWGYTENKTFSAVWERDENSAFTVTVDMPANKEFKFTTIATGQFWVDWDDGSNIEEYAPTTITTKTWTHTYTTAGTYDIKIGGRATGYAVSADGTPETKSAISFFNGTLSSETDMDATVSVAGTEQYITEVSGKLGAIFPTITAGSWGGQPRFYRTFKNTTAMDIELQSIADLFDGVSGTPVPYMFAETFDGSAVTGAIPAGLFPISGAVKEMLFLSTFRNCTGLTGTIPDLFASINGAPKQYMFSRTFRGCTNLTGIPAGLFRGISGAPATGMFMFTFYGCTNITGTLSSNLFGTLNGPVVKDMFRSTFYNCTSLVGDASDSTIAIPAGLFGQLTTSTTAATSAFRATFYGCQSLRGKIGNALFGGLTGSPAEYMFSNTFNTCGDRDITTNCSNLNGAIPTNLFGNMTGAPKQSMFNATFKGASKLTGAIPSKLFGTITGAPVTSMFKETFKGCSGLTGIIPANLFENISGLPAGSMFYSTFYGCSHLSGIGGALFSGISGRAVSSMFFTTFYNCSGLTGSIPAGLFGTPTTPANWMFSQTFYGCSGLTGEIPSGLFGSVSGPAAEYMFDQTFRGCSGLTGTIPSDLFGTLSNAGKTGMFRRTFQGCSHLTGYVPEGLFGTMTVPSTVPDGMMSYVFADSGLLTECPCGTEDVSQDSPFYTYWRSTSASANPKKVSCRVDTTPGNYYWYNGQCTTTCSDTAIDELHVGNLDPYVVLADPVSTVKNLAVKHNDTICYVPVASGNGGASSLNMKYGNAVYHADRPTTTAPAGFGQR